MDALKDKKLNGWKFRKQHPIGSFILDFYCHSAKLGIELDGGYHDTPEQIVYDANRTAVLESAGVKIIRFRNEQIINELNKVLKEILEKLNSRLFDPKNPCPTQPPLKGHWRKGVSS